MEKKFLNLIFSLIVISGILYSTTSYAKSLKRPQSIEITQLRLVGNPHDSSNVTLTIKLLPHINCKINLTIRFPKKIKYYDGSSILTIGLKNCDSGQIITQNIHLLVQDTVSSLIEVYATVANPPDGYSKDAHQYLEVNFISQDFRVFTSTLADSTYYNGKFSCYQNLTVERSSAQDRTRLFNISGSVFSFDPKEGGRKEGLYNCNINLFFGNHSNPNTLVTLGDGTQEHMNYDIIHEDGTFSFLFGTQYDLSGYDEIVLLIAPFNDYISFNPTSGYVLNTDKGTIFTFGCSEGAKLPFNPANNNTNISSVDIEINGQDGAICRNLEFAGEMLKQRYSGSIPWGMPLVYVSKVPLDPSTAGEFDANPTGAHAIHIDPNCTEISVCTHEFGHYVNYQMWGGSWYNWYNSQNYMEEGWAIFYSFAAREYAERVYGDEADDGDEYSTGDDNLEREPYVSPRFAGMRYSAYPDYCAFGCYLWNLYDSYTDGNFKTTQYDNSDNDDADFGVRVFDEMQWVPNCGVASYNNYFKMGLNYEQEISVDKVYNNFYVNPNDKMASAQISNDATAVVQSSTSIKFDWQSQSYQSCYYQNPEENYKLYSQTANENPWVLIATISYGTNTYTYNHSNVTKYNYKLTSSNSSGDSFGGKIFTFDADPQCEISIEGPLVLNEPNSGIYSAEVSGGNGVYGYHWYVSYDNGDTWISKVTTSTFTFYPIWENPSALVRLDVNSGLQEVSTNVDVDIHCTGCGSKPISGISDNINTERIKVYPNPVNQYINFNFLSNTGVKLYNITGQIVINLEHFSGNSIDLNDLNSGVYVIEFISSEGRCQYSRITIVKER